MHNFFMGRFYFWAYNLYGVDVVKDDETFVENDEDISGHKRQQQRPVQPDPRVYDAPVYTSYIKLYTHMFGSGALLEQKENCERRQRDGGANREHGEVDGVSGAQQRRHRAPRKVRVRSPSPVQKTLFSALH